MLIGRREPEYWVKFLTTDQSNAVFCSTSLDRVVDVVVVSVCILRILATFFYHDYVVSNFSA